MLGAVDGDVLAGAIHVVLAAIGNQVVHTAGDGGAEEPGEGRQHAEGRHQRQGDGGEGGGDQGDDGLAVDSTGVVVGALGGVAVEVGDVHLGPADQPVVDHDDAVQRPQQGAQSGEEIDDHQWAVVEVPGQDQHRQGSAYQAGAAEVQPARRQAGEHEGRRDEVGNDVHRYRHDQERQAAQHQEGLVGYGGDDLGRAVDDLAIEAELRTGEHEADNGEQHDVDR
ncbi:hypothetical protein D9M69_436130 [compost metagenome]